jgi:hypothetical protein
MTEKRLTGFTTAENVMEFDAVNDSYGLPGVSRMFPTVVRSGPLCGHSQGLFLGEACSNCRRSRLSGYRVANLATNHCYQARP